MAKLIVECNDEQLLQHILRGVVTDLAHFEMMTKQPARAREARKARASATIKGGR